jgi:hypothetical protein
MRLRFIVLICLLAFSVPLALGKNEARVTHIVREVNVLREDATRRPASLHQKVTEDEAVRTGGKSKSELSFPDTTLARLGENSIFSFKGSGRVTNLGGGSMLLHVRKGSQANIRTAAVTVGITGTTLLLETARGGRSKLTLLEGSARISLNQNARQTAIVRDGQMIDVPAGTTKLPPVQTIDVSEVMKTHPLIVGFRPLPSQNQIASVIEQQQGATAAGPIYQGRAVIGSTSNPLASQFHPRAGVQPPHTPGNDGDEGAQRKKRRRQKER